MNENVILNLGGGGGTPLNFKVVGNPQPTNPSENTIWLNTDVPIGRWYFSATQPEGLNAGDVWFSVGYSSPVAFNALKKNGVMVYPLSAKQYIDGALVDKTAKIYQNGEWVGWIRYLLNGSDLYESITGGWVVEADVEGYTVTPMQATNSGLVLTSGSSGYMGRVRPKNKIDLTNIKTLYFDILVTTKFNSSMRVYAAQNVTGKYSGFGGAEKIFTESGTVSLDVSNLGAGNYVGVSVYNRNDQATNKSNITIKAVRYE